MTRICESHVEEAALKWFEELRWSTLHGPDIAPGELASERASYSDMFLARPSRRTIELSRRSIARTGGENMKGLV